MRVYISGPITGVPDGNKAAFKAAAVELEARGHDVVNPAELEVPGWTWKDYLHHDLKILLKCDAIHMLPGWIKSKGARFEYMVARKLKYEVIK